MTHHVVIDQIITLKGNKTYRYFALFSLHFFYLVFPVGCPKAFWEMQAN